MRYPVSIFILLFTVVAGCKTTYPNDKKLSYTAPVKIFDKWATKKTSLGTPDKNGDNFYSYFAQGMIVYTDAAGVKVTGLVFTWFQGGKSFKGDIYGIKIGDTYPKVVRLWGEPAATVSTKEDYYEKSWTFNKFKISAQFWSHEGDDADLGGHFEAETVKRIQITS